MRLSTYRTTLVYNERFLQSIQSAVSWLTGVGPLDSKAGSTPEAEASQVAVRYARLASSRTKECLSVSGRRGISVHTVYEEGHSSSLLLFDLPTTYSSDHSSLSGMWLGSLRHLHESRRSCHVSTCFCLKCIPALSLLYTYRFFFWRFQYFPNDFTKCVVKSEKLITHLSFFIQISCFINATKK